MLRIIMLCFGLVFLSIPAFSQVKAVIEEVSGKVEVKTPRGRWQPAKVGMNVVAGTYVSTGFRSRARLDMGGSTVWVKPLTRMQLEELGGAWSSEL